MNAVTFPAGQVRILKALSKAAKSLTGERLTTAAKLASRAWLSEYLGCEDSANGGFIMKAGKRTSVRKLIPAGLVRPLDRLIEKGDKGGDSRERAYEITGSGKTTLRRLLNGKA